MVNQNRPLPSGKLTRTMVVTVAAPFEARGGRVAEEGKCPGPGRQARGGGDIGTCSLRPDPGGHQTTEETDPRPARKAGRGEGGPVASGIFLVLRVGPVGGVRARVRIPALAVLACASCLTAVFPGEVRALSVSSASPPPPPACPDVWVSRPARPGPCASGALSFLGT